jgi:hypothetical protein
MAAYTGTPTVDTSYSYEVGDRNGKFIMLRKKMSITLAAQGGATNTIGDAALGFASGGIIEARAVLFTDGSAQKRTVWLFTDGTNVYVGDPTNATDATRAIPGDVTGTLVLIVEGRAA